MNKCYLSRIFKEITGFTVNGYLHARRIQKARSLLIQNSMNISEVAEAAGYENLTYLSGYSKNIPECHRWNIADNMEKGGGGFRGIFLNIQKISLEILRPLILFTDCRAIYQYLQVLH